MKMNMLMISIENMFIRVSLISEQQVQYMWMCAFLQIFDKIVSEATCIADKVVSAPT